MTSTATKLKPEIPEKYKLSGNTLFHTVKNNPHDRLEVEIGDSKQPDFKPQFKLMRWNNECNFSIRAEERHDSKLEIDGEIIKYITPEYEVHQYDKPDASDEGGFEFEWVLYKKPKSNVFKTTIQSKNVEFYYQPELTEEEKAQRCSQEDRAVGSYAVYHSGNPVNYIGRIQYKVGKVAHIYRPKAIDDRGNAVWCTLYINKNVLFVTVPQEFLNSAVYPVVVDPTFGYTTAGSGGTVAFFNTQAATSAMVNPGTASPGQSVTKFTAYMSSQDGTSRSLAASAYTQKKYAITVSDAGTTSVNGDYYGYSESGGKPYYEGPGGASIQYNSLYGRWYFYDGASGGYALLYVSDITSSDVDSASWWADQGTEPVPFITFNYYSPNAQLAAATNITTSSSSLGWVDSAAVSQSLTNGTTYVVGFSGQNAGNGVSNAWVNIAYDNGSIPGRINSSATSLGTDFSPTGTDSGRRYSVYATYGSPPSTNQKTFNGVARASVKTVNGVAIASVKSFNGVT